MFLRGWILRLCRAPRGAAAAQGARSGSDVVPAVPGRDEDRLGDHRPGGDRRDPAACRRGWGTRPACAARPAGGVTGALPDSTHRLRDALRAAAVGVCPKSARGTRKSGRKAPPDAAARRPEGVRTSWSGFARSAGVGSPRRRPRAGDPACSQEVRADTIIYPSIKQRSFAKPLVRMRRV